MTLPIRSLACLFLLTCTTSNLLAKETAEGSPDVGQKVADFELPVVGGDEDETVTLSKQYAEGPVVVIVLRGFPGYQCPLCSEQVGAMINRAKKLDEKASRVILVYPGPASMLDVHAEEFMGARTLPAPLVMVRDPDMKMVDAWGLRWNAPRETAYPASFVIDTEGKVVWKKVSDSHAGRSNAEEMLGVLRKL